ncbi:unnamed protein product, partial [marine sediment metagenome]
VTPNNDEIEVGDTIRINTEKMLVTAKPTGTTCTITRAQENTYAYEHGIGQVADYAFNIYIQEKATTDSNGQVEYAGGDKSAIATKMSSQIGAGTINSLNSGTFTMKVYKDGYETYQAPMEISGFNGIDCGIKLRNSLTQGRDDMGDAFK